MQALILALFLTASSVLCMDALSVKGVEYAGTSEIAGHGRGIAVSKHLVITALHIIMDSLDVNYRTPMVNVAGKWHEAKIAAVDKENDLALLELPKEAKLEIAEELELPPMQVLGDIGLNPSTRRDVKISSFIMDVADLPVKTASDVGGLSGGPVLCEGRLIGIVSRAAVSGGKVQVWCIGPEPIRKLIESYNGKQ